MVIDIPSPIDLRLMAHASAWAESAMVKRPWRSKFFQAFVDAVASDFAGDHGNELAALSGAKTGVEHGAANQRSISAPVRILELGSGPGFLAQALLQAFPSSHYVALDFSAAMHQLAKQRLGQASARVNFVLRSFKQADWTLDLPKIDCVVTLQAVHELRHKAHAVALHRQVKAILQPHGHYYVCDHYAGEGGMGNTELYMTVSEQEAALHAAGFSSVKAMLQGQGLVLHQASP